MMAIVVAQLRSQSRSMSSAMIATFTATSINETYFAMGILARRYARMERKTATTRRTSAK